MITLTVGQHHTLTAQFLDSLSQPVPVDPARLVWTTDDETIVSLGPVIKQDLPPVVAPQTTGLVAVIKAIAPGIVNVTASYDSGMQVFQNVTQVQVNPPAVASISVT
jgi:hypothetical protein